MPSYDREPIEPGSYGDPIANLTAWTPCVPGGTNFRTHSMQIDGADRVHFRPSIGAIFFAMIFFGIGAVIFYAGIAAAFDAHAKTKDAIVPILFGAIFGLPGTWLLYSMTRPIVFHR